MVYGVVVVLMVWVLCVEVVYSCISNDFVFGAVEYVVVKCFGCVYAVGAVS